MLPHYNSFPHNSNQVHVNGSSAPSHQIQPQLGIKNNQVPIPFSNANAHLSNGHGGAMPNMPPSMIAQPNFMGVPNNLHPMQSNHLGMPQFGSVGPTSQPGQPHVGFFGSQNNAHSMNSVASFPLHGQFCNLVQNVNQAVSSQPPGQLLGHNLLNLPQQINQNMGLPYGQFCLPNPLQNMNQFVQMQMHNPSQLGPNYAFAGLNQAPQATVSQNSPFFATHQFGNVHSNQAGQQVNQNQQNLVLPAMQGTQFGAYSNQAGQQVNQNQQNSVLPAKQGTQGNHTNTGGVYSSNTNWKHSPSKSFTKHPKRGVQLQGGFQNSQFHHMKNAKGKFAFPNGNKGKGLINESKGKFTNQGGEGKRSLSLPYTEQEIQRWREERRRHYPSKSNIEKKLSEKLINSEVIEREAKMRREQLKEILTKQAELGVEVAEIPSYYLEDSNQGHRREDNKSFTKKGRLPNNFGKREKYDKKDRFAKRQKSHHKDSSNDPSFSKREPTLLQKLLSADIKRDRSRLLQVFRFMVTNSFFKDCPEKPLKFPTVAVKESGCNEDMAEELSSLAAKDASKGSDNSMVEIVHNNDYEYHNDVCNYDDGGGEDDEEGGIERAEEEEGEIIN
ncbi:uncharacterized protein LOC18786222 isoform X2 [Prunus persica]|uniref:uncharacterized protein LOC18786222 isoform X2 n=1 Tax=Prunus persica TaxID=3760 RepID=UPI0009AB514C|nr:uncharacterized protein LOC18786222 isoform X2 [Prunus persica]